MSPFANPRSLIPIPHSPAVLICGASTRSASHSAIRAGLAPLCADQFADFDLRSCAAVIDIEGFPRGLVALAAAAPTCPWVYTGGLENHRRIVAALSRDRPLWGNPADVLRQVRDPWRVADALRQAGLPALDIRPTGAAPPPPDGQWMLKNRHSAGGRGVAIWDSGAAHVLRPKRDGYFQRRQTGTPYSAVYLALPGRTILLGATRQLVGSPEAHAPHFAWCGNIAPADLPRTTIVTMRRIGQTLGSGFSLRGLFGCDFLVEQGVPWLTEINPRYPGSTELIEFHLRVPLFDWHRRACEMTSDSGAARDAVGALTGEIEHALVPAESALDSAQPNVPVDPRAAEFGPRREVLGKIIVYAPQDLIAPDLTRFAHQPTRWRSPRSQVRPPTDPEEALPQVADIPVPGTPIKTGQPICTLFARARTEQECLTQLLQSATDFQTASSPSPSGRGPG